MVRFESTVFNGSSVRIDNIKYIACTFNNCSIEYGGEGPISLERCNFNSCTWTLVGHARQTINFLQTMHSSFGDFGRAMVEAVFDNIKNPPKRNFSIDLPDADL